MTVWNFLRKISKILESFLANNNDIVVETFYLGVC